MMLISPLRQSIIAITLLSIIAIMIYYSSQHDMVDRAEQYEYDRDGRLICRIIPDGSKIKYKYNEQGLPIEIEYPDDTVKYVYDANGNRIWMQSKAGKTSYKYDAFDRLIKVVYNYSPAKELQYEYDPWSRISSIRIYDAQNNQYQVKYEYNILGNIVSIDDGNGKIEYNYSTDKGEIVRQLPNGIRTVFSYSPADELISIKHFDSQNSLLASYRYEYSPHGKISRVFEETSEGLNITKFEWDNRGYLKTLQLPDGKSMNYEYDVMGNRISMKDSKGTIAYKYDGFGRLIAAGATKYEWDGNGNLMTQIDNNTKTRFRYDARNLPQLVKTSNESFRYKWDGDGNMISRSAGKDSNHYMPNPLAPSGFNLAEFDSNGRLKRTYLYGDSLLGHRDANGRMKYFLEDGFNSIRLVADVNGKIIGQQNFTPFAEPTLMKGETADNFRMMGERFLPEIGKSFIGNRLYDPSTGRYLSPDPSNFMEPRSNQNIEQQPAIGSIWLNLKSLPIVREKWDWPGNFIGRLFNLNWFGRNVTGGRWYEYFLDERNQFPLGNTTIPGRSSIDMAARKHDIQYYINTHFDRGTWVQVPGPRGDEYFKSLGSSTYWPAWWTNLRLIRDSLLSLLPFAHHGGRTSLPPGQTAIPLRRYSSKSNDLHTGNVQTRGFQNQFFPFDNEITDRDRKKYYSDKKPVKGPDWPDGGGGGGGGPGGHSGPFGGGFHDPFKSIEGKLGGIKLDATAQFAGNLGNITGLVYDPESKCFILVGDGNLSLPSIKPEDLAIALMSVFGPIPQDPQFTLDPADPKDPRGKWLKAVYIPEQIIGGTDFGKALYEADWLLKQYAFGVTVDKQWKIHERTSSVNGFKSTKDLMFEQKDKTQGHESWARFWIVSDKMTLKQSGKSILFDVAKMRVKAKKIVPDPRSPQGFSDVDSEDNHIATQFASLFTKLYDDISRESPEFERVRQLTKAVAIAKWIKKESIMFDPNWVNEYAKKRVPTTGQVTALSTLWEKRSQTPFQKNNHYGVSTEIYRVHLFGGVDLTVTPEFHSDDGSVNSLREAIVAKFRSGKEGPAFSVDHKGKSLQAVVLPITQAGQELWKNSPTVTSDGQRYQFSSTGKVVKSVDQDGNITKYVWDTNHNLTEFKIAAKNGWFLLGNRKGDYSEITVTNPKGNVFLYRYTPTGNLREVYVNGQRYATLSYIGDGGVTIDYGNFVERITYDRSNRIQRYETQVLQNDKPHGRYQVLNINYDKEGAITELTSPENGSIKVNYAHGHIQTLSTPRGKVSHSYTENGKIGQIASSWGESIKYAYQGNNLTEMTYRNGDYNKSVIFENGFPVVERDSNNASTKYKYSSKGLLDQVVDSTGATGNYSFDDHGRIKKINLPDGSSVNYQYDWYRSNDEKESSLKKVKIIHTASKTSSSPIVKEKQGSIPKKEASAVLTDRLGGLKEASRNLNNGLIIDLFVDDKDIAHSHIFDNTGNVLKLTPENTKEFKKLLNITASVKGKLGRTLLDGWQKFYDAHLLKLNRTTERKCPDGKTVKIKPLLIINSNEVNYKYANLEKVPVLIENFIIFIASKTERSKDIKETSVKDLTTRINNIPKLTKANVAFIIRLPNLNKERHRDWNKEVKELQGIIGKDNVLFNPDKREFSQKLQDRRKDIVVIELTHTNKGIILKNEELFTSVDVLQAPELSHIKYLLSGIGTCQLAQLEDGKLASSLRKKGVGIINATYSEISGDIALNRFRDLIQILKKIEKYDMYPYYLLDIIDQRLGISGEGTINLGKRKEDGEHIDGNC